jgi:hypothetical protein
LFRSATIQLKSKEKGGTLMKHIKLRIVAIALVLILAAGFAVAGTLDDVKAKGYISVGVNEGLFGFSKPDEKGVCSLISQNPFYSLTVR